MSERGEYSPARIKRLMSFALNPKLTKRRDQVCFDPRSIRPNIVTNEAPSPNIANEQTVVYEASKVEETISS